MRRNLLLLWILAISLVTLATGDELDNSPKPCRVQSHGDQLRCVIPAGYKVRSGDCPGNDIYHLIWGNTVLEACAWVCSRYPECQGFMFYDNHGCYPKFKTCGTTSKDNPLNVFYDKVPTGYTMRPGDCSGNDLGNHIDKTRQECAQNCDLGSLCHAFMHHDNKFCLYKEKGCAVPSLGNSLDIFYDELPQGYSLRGGDCPGNDISSIQGSVSLTECANRCNSDRSCVSFMHSDGKQCYPKTRSCAQPSTKYPKDLFYDKLPYGYAMRPGDCPGNDIGGSFGVDYVSVCASFCDGKPQCVSFMIDMAGWAGSPFICYLKYKTCQTTDKAYPKNFFYDKIVTVKIDVQK